MEGDIGGERVGGEVGVGLNEMEVVEMVDVAARGRGRGRGRAGGRAEGSGRVRWGVKCAL